MWSGRAGCFFYFPLRIDNRIYGAHTRDMTTTRELAAAHLATKTNDELLEMSALLEGKQDEAGRAVRAAVSDAITDRFDIWEILDRIYDEDFEGTYHDAMVLSIAEKATK